MKRITYILGAALLTTFSGAQAEQKAPKKLKSPHNHMAEQGGTVLMFGDDHLEIRRGKKATEIVLYFTDKLRDPVPATGFNFEVNLVAGKARTKLATTPMPGMDNSLSVRLPDNAAPDAKLELRATRLVPPHRGYVTTTSAQTLPLSKVAAPQSDPHAGHKM